MYHWTLIQIFNTHKHIIYIFFLVVINVKNTWSLNISYLIFLRLNNIAIKIPLRGVVILLMIKCTIPQRDFLTETLKYLHGKISHLTEHLNI